MRAHDLTNMVNQKVAEKGVGGSQIMVQSEDGRMFTPRTVMVEHHDDGTATVWLKVTEF
jgi:hypothetical protein